MLLEQEVSPLRSRNWIGGATEHFAIGHLLERGHKVAIPVVDDDGVDLIVDYSFRVQVKSSRLHYVTRGQPHWVFKSPSGWRADVYVLRGVDPNRDRWWVVPHSVLAEVGLAQTISVKSRRGSGKWGIALDEFEDAWHVFG